MTFDHEEISQIQLSQVELFKELLNSNTPVSLKSSGNSMFPIIKSNDILIVKSKENQLLKKGNLVVFLSGKNLVCHRIKRVISQKIFETQGDSCLHSDGYIPEDEILGIVVQKKNKSNLPIILSKSASKIFGQFYRFVCFFLLKLMFQRKKICRK